MIKIHRFLSAKTSIFKKDESGATAIEYGLIAALISVAIIAGASALGGKLKTTFNDIGSCMGADTGTCANVAGEGQNGLKSE
ncbi:Flp family type IVb pilin [Pararhizobium mangrovi]|uniref:Flp family type IVb pilin n=1 Tax=Pararhizobium mangrovi TaxID=2590452 RepID=A0A506U3I9_9HYPH|nr:Flp family type IVb pilin [Pararhizobium mangrovi]TPW27604.1 Flp family type IVb pilin [Pararhizobium mangrovi]